MPTRAEILDILAASQTQVMAFFQGLSPQDLERAGTASDVPGAAPWRARDHFAHLVKNERAIQHLLRRALAGEDARRFLTSSIPGGNAAAGHSGRSERADLGGGGAAGDGRRQLNQACVDAHHDDSVEMLAADFLAAPQDTVDLLHQFTDDQLAAPCPPSSVSGHRRLVGRESGACGRAH